MADVGAAEPRPTPALRPELRFFPRVQDGTPELLLEDPLTLRFYRIGEREHAFMTRLDGKRGAGEALARANLELGEPLDENEAAEILRFLYREGLLRTRGSCRGSAWRPSSGTSFSARGFAGSMPSSSGCPSAIRTGSSPGCCPTCAC